MKNPKELFLEYLVNIKDIDRVVDLFAEDAVIEIPYLESINIPSRNEGKEGVRAFINFVFSTMPDFKFENIVVHMETEDQAFVEYHANALVPATGKYYNQHFFGRLVAENGKIKLISESLNPVISARAMFPNGTGGIPA